MIVGAQVDDICFRSLQRGFAAPGQSYDHRFSMVIQDHVYKIKQQVVDVIGIDD